MLYKIPLDMLCNFRKDYFQKQIRERIKTNKDVEWLYEYADKVLDYKSWYYVSRYSNVMENKKFLSRYKYRLWWRVICKYQKLELSAYCYFYDEIKSYWGIIIHSNNVIPTEILLSDMFPYYCWESLARYGNLPYKTLKDVGHKINWKIYTEKRTKYKCTKAIREFFKQ